MDKNDDDLSAQHLEGPGRPQGYRWMYNKSLKNGVCVQEEDFCGAAALSPYASSTRRSKRQTIITFIHEW